MMLCNKTSRYDVAIAAIAGGARTNPRVAVDAHTLISYFQHRARLDKKYIYENGKGKHSDFVDLSAVNVQCNLDPVGTFDTPTFA